MISEISSFHEMHNEKETVFILEGIKHIDYKSVPEEWEELSLVEYAIDTSLGDDTEYKNNNMALDISFIANSCPVPKCSTFQTLPNPPFPIILR